VEFGSHARFDGVFSQLHGGIGQIAALVHGHNTSTQTQANDEASRPRPTDQARGAANHGRNGGRQHRETHVRGPILDVTSHLF
jgi:hypothetical protein